MSESLIKVTGCDDKIASIIENEFQYRLRKSPYREEWEQACNKVVQEQTNLVLYGTSIPGLSSVGKTETLFKL